MASCVLSPFPLSTRRLHHPTHVLSPSQKHTLRAGSFVLRNGSSVSSRLSPTPVSRFSGKFQNLATPLPDNPLAAFTEAATAEDIQSAVELLKEAAKTRKVAGEEVFSALQVIERAKLDPTDFLETLGGTASPGNTWMLIFTVPAKEIQKGLKGGVGTGSYFPITAIQRFDATASEIENGVFLGPIGSLTFKGPLGWKGRRLSFLFDTLSLKLGSLPPWKFNIGKKEDQGRTPGVGKEGSKDPFFLWFFADDEIVVARGRGGGSAFWCRCKRV